MRNDGTPTELDKYFEPREIDPHAVDRLSASDVAPASNSELTPVALGLFVGIALAQVWGLNYNAAGPKVKADCRAAGRQVLKECGGDVDEFEWLCGAAMKEADWLKWTRQCLSAYGVSRNLCAWLAKYKAQPDEGDKGKKYLDYLSDEYVKPGAEQARTKYLDWLE